VVRLVTRDRYALCDASCTVDCGACKGAGQPRAAGAIGRAVVDAAAAYSQRLADLWAAQLSRDAGPWDD
jgi:hypothetical protein